MISKFRFSNIANWLCTLLFLEAIPFSAFAATIRVPKDQSTIQAAIDVAATGDTVLVADGTYAGDGNTNIDFRGKTIIVQSENGPENCVVDLEGSLVNGFVFESEETQDSLLTGFSVINGSCGIFVRNSSPTISHCIISRNSSGGISFRDSASSTISDCTISENIGIGIYCSSSSTTIVSCTIRDNLTTNRGAGIYFDDCIAPTVTNCLIIDNTAYQYAGGIWSRSSAPTITNCTISGNVASSYCGVDLGGLAVIKNTIIYGNDPDTSYFGSGITITYSDIAGYSGEGTGNINVNPLFVGSGDYRLLAGSPCINTGTASGSPDTDIDGNSRPQGSGYDMGAYEYMGSGHIEPTANAGVDQAVFNAVNLDGSHSTDPDGSISSYVWNLKYRGSSSYDRTAAGVKATLSSLEPGFYDVTLTVTDNQGLSNTDTMLLSAMGINCDFNGDGDVDGSDLQIFSTKYGK